MKNNNFKEIFEKINNKPSLLGFKKTKVLFDEFQKMTNHGLSAEIGVFQGFTSKLIAILNANNKHYCYDTFKGVIKSDPAIDKVPDGGFCSSLEEVKNNINLMNVIYKEGTFPETFEESDCKFSFVHSDTDTYFGAKATLDYFSNLMLQGGKIIFDDYKWHLCPGIEKAVHEFIASNKDFHFSESVHQAILTKI